MPRLAAEPLEGRAVPAVVLPTTYAVGEDTAGDAGQLYADPGGTRARTGDPTLNAPFAAAVAADGTTSFAVGQGPAMSGGARVARADFTGDGIADLAVASGPGTANLFRVYNGNGGALVFQGRPFEAGFTGGLYVAAGDVTGDGVADLIVTPDQGGGPRVEVYRGQGLTLAADFFGIDDPNFRGGARAAVGDLNADGRGDLFVAAGFGGGPRVAVYDGGTLGNLAGLPPTKLVGDFFVFEQSLRNGAFVAAGDLDGDGTDDLFAGGGPGGGPRVLVLSGAGLRGGATVPLADFFAGDPSSRSGVRVAVKNLDNDGRADLLTGAGPGGGSRVRVYAGATLAAGPAPTPTRDANAFPDFYFADGVFVG